MHYKKIFVFILALIIAANALAVGPYGSRQHRKLGIMDGNQVVTEFYNYGMIANWPDQPAGIWPKGTNHSYVDGVALIVSASTHDSQGNLIHPMSTQYREFMDRSEVTGNPIGWEPLPGYANPSQDEPAMSDNPESWPLTWPGKPHAWDGFWNGYFGKGVTNADLETLFAMDDATDDEYDFYPDSTDSYRRGLGMRVKARAFQWNHVLAEDCIFWHYAIENIGTTEYDSTVFGMYIDWGVGGTNDSGDDAGSYDTGIDLAYSWDGNGRGTPGGWGPVGYAGFAFLESPGIGYDNIDNDEDGMIDERRDDGIDNDGDWDPYTDLNENDVWDDGEPLNDDLGEDGVGPYDPSYRGPDRGEGDGFATAGEPDFDQTDKDESDQIGLTAFTIFPVHYYELTNEEHNWSVMSQLVPPTEEQLLGSNLGMYFFAGIFPMAPEQIERFSMALLFGNDKDDLFRNKNTVQAIYNANYNFAQPPNKPALVAVPSDKKVTLYWDDNAEQSYDRFLQEYDFEGYKVYRSTDPSFIDSKLVTDSYGNPTYRKPLAQYDLVDGKFGPHLVGVHGAHFDLGEEIGLRHSLIDTSVINGVTYYYGVVSYDYGFIATETIIDSLIGSDDSDSVVTITFPLLDDEGQVMGIAPTECTSTIIGEVGLAAKLDINTAMVTPDAPAAGYVSPKLINGINHIEGNSSGNVSVNIVLNDSLEDGHTYHVKFKTADTYGDFLRFTESFIIVDSTSGDTVLEGGSPYFGEFAPYGEGDPVFFIEQTGAKRRWKYFTIDPTDSNLVFWNIKDSEVESNLVDGFTVVMDNPFIDYIDDDELGLDSIDADIISGTNYAGEVLFYPALKHFSLKVPYSYEIRWADVIIDTSISKLANPAIPVKFTVWNLTLDEPTDFIYIEESGEWIDPEGETKEWVEDAWIIPSLMLPNPDDYPEERNFSVFTWGIHLTAPPFDVDTTITGIDTTYDSTWVEKIPMGAGDIVRIVAPVPFSEDDVFSFTVSRGHLDNELEKSDFDRIAVVPNPYVATVAWEPRVSFSTGRGQRKIDFIHLPRECTIRIYTLSGFLVKKIDHRAPEIDGSESWDLVSKDGMDIAYGLYIFHVNAPGVGEKIGKFAVVK
ncbi:MAG: hypothetical protein P9L92_05625 [Candidatus Electryonea clarkiae]|nr:hypothetical protein [Candidatus Electryonea clarkiae]MDP8289335.1 hypothetical protein [Candidatus Electryonea clarkiae]